MKRVWFHTEIQGARADAKEFQPGESSKNIIEPAKLVVFLPTERVAIGRLLISLITALLIKRHNEWRIQGTCVVEKAETWQHGGTAP